jgi:signal transduction histidine kinase
MEARRLVNGLRALALDDLGLAGALDLLVTEEKTRAGWVRADFVHNVAGQRFDQTIETTVYRVAQEALTNARKHAQAQTVRLSLLLGENALTLEVCDRGAGFVPEQKTGEYGHLGLHAMAERTALLGGRYDLQSAPGMGTTVRANFPVPAYALNPHLIPEGEQ